MVSFYPESCKKALGYIGSHSRRDGNKAVGAGLTPIEIGQGVTLLCTDGYAILLASYLKKQNGKLDPAFRETFIDNKGRQFAAVLSDIGAKKDVSEIKNKVTSVVNKVLVKWLTIFENEFTDSPEEVKEACIETFSKWLYLSI